jgi:hypothetical protein
LKKRTPEPVPQIPNNSETYEIELECTGCHVKVKVRRWKKLEMVNEYITNSYTDLPYRCEDCIEKKLGL